MANVSRGALQFANSDREILKAYLPPKDGNDEIQRPFTTLTFATSLDSSLALSPGTQTVLSGPQSKAMTHYLRSRYDAILIGVGTAIADNPSLNCRIEGVGGYGGNGLEGQPRPIVVDPYLRWDFSRSTKVLSLADEGKGRAPFIFCAKEPQEEKVKLLESLGGKFVILGISDTGPLKGRLDWVDILQGLAWHGIKSVMVEGGGTVINDLLRPHYASLIDSVIVTIAPTWLGQGGVVVSPPRRVSAEGNYLAAARLKEVKWHPLGEDVVLCGKL
ncbi:putative riboflavin biosynthesis protein Rib7 [Lepidopterella palustris CBS 459.81]|uniref:2,5-diamino-6-ribosylamino-4(3H)-pyrimidinone 5'-phosphate reductase n=1 Tax=Lepidopterella palustris CBS 459.81 TaxID=1314670 RepID=A0A8E2E9V8_9PEZI|nr:putative riboflavin biosynthesis protein Rib7 [Lepidopterella palustris CBS 459.81]